MIVFETRGRGCCPRGPLIRCEVDCSIGREIPLLSGRVGIVDGESEDTKVDPQFFGAFSEGRNAGWRRSIDTTQQFFSDGENLIIFYRVLCKMQMICSRFIIMHLQGRNCIMIYSNVVFSIQVTDALRPTSYFYDKSSGVLYRTTYRVITKYIAFARTPTPKPPPQRCIIRLNSGIRLQGI